MLSKTLMRANNMLVPRRPMAQFMYTNSMLQPGPALPPSNWNFYYQPNRTFASKVDFSDMGDVFKVNYTEEFD